jgi:hypothetical protein
VLGTCESLGVRLKLNSLNPPYTAVVQQPQTRRRSRGRTKELGPGPGVGLLSLPPTRLLLARMYLRRTLNVPDSLAASVIMDES